MTTKLRCGVCDHEGPPDRFAGRVMDSRNQPPEEVDVCNFCYGSGGWSRYGRMSLNETLQAAAHVYHCIEDSLDRRSAPPPGARNETT